MNLFELLIVFGGGFLAGCINVLAGNGSAITLFILTDVAGLSPLVANGTNRVGILAHSIITTYTFEKKEGIDRVEVKFILPFIFAGGILGGYLATQVSNEQFVQVYRFFLIVLFGTLLLNPKRWLQPDLFNLNWPKWIQGILLFFIGLYGGFIQMGMGIMMLATFVLIRGMPIMKANGIKLLAVLSFTLVIIWIFLFNDMIDWKSGLIMALGQILGGFLTVHFLVGWKHANSLAYYALCFIIILALAKSFLF